METKEYKIDATGKIIGRVASQAAKVLMGKDSVNYKANVAPAIKVHIEHAAKAKISPQKLEQKEYKSFSGHPSGLKIRTMQEVIDKHGYEKLFENAVYGMLPSNKLRSVYMKNLIVTE